MQHPVSQAVSHPAPHPDGHPEAHPDGEAGTRVPGYAVAYLRDVDVNEAIIDYLQRIDATLAPYGGRFLVHGGEITPAEGTWDGDLVILEFPSVGAAQAWYDSPGYRDILALRVENSTSIAALVEGVPPGYQATDKLAALVSG